MTQLTIVFAGTPEFALPCLDALMTSRHKLVAVYTQPDRPAGRGRKLQPSAVKQWATLKNLPVFQPINFKTDEAIDELAALKPDILIVIAYGLILPKKVLAIPRLGCINVHASLLPHWRGASPIQQAILHGDSQSGVTIMQMDAGMDTGDSLARVSCQLDSDETAGTLHDKLAAISAKPLLATLDDLAAGQAQPVPQIHANATYASKINKEDGCIDWTQSAEIIDRKIRAYNPWPIAYTHANNETMRIYEAKIEPDSSAASPGTVIAMNKNGLFVATGTEVMSIQRIQFPGGKMITISDWLNATRHQLYVNLVLQ